MPLRLWIRDRDRRRDPAPIDATGYRAVLVGTAAWAIATVAVLAFPEATGASGDPAVLVTCGVGVLLGLIGLVYTGRRTG
jgi:Protein of unknown function (DUF2530)